MTTNYEAEDFFTEAEDFYTESYTAASQNRFKKEVVSALVALGMTGAVLGNELTKDEDIATVGAGVLAIGAVAYWIKQIRDGRQHYREMQERGYIEIDQGIGKWLNSFSGIAEVPPYSLYEGSVDPSIDMIRGQLGIRLDPDDDSWKVKKSEKPKD